VLKFSDVLGLGTSIILFHLKTYPVTFSEALESRHIDGREMDKYVLTAILTDKAKTFFSLNHLTVPSAIRLKRSISLTSFQYSSSILRNFRLSFLNKDSRIRNF